MKIGIIGCGKMATALIKGVIEAGVVGAGDVMGISRTEASRERFAKATGAGITANLEELVSHSDVLLLGTKPQDVYKTLSDCRFDGKGDKLLISVAAGVTLENLEKHTPAEVRVVRTMPNTPSLIGKGATGYCLGERCVPEDEKVVSALLDAVGLSSRVPEKLMNAVVGVSGSGPAYIYMIIEAMADGGVLCGLPREDALKLAAQTVSGAAEMVLQTGQHPAVLKDMVTSPGGTTITALAVLEEKNVRSAFIKAVGAACDKATELGKN
ncbi:pyrroline-5-carboxylate reductase [Luteolibacter algae]|uniref:Pyrroline-5-carboxylate reductase n=2 Tax=Luteolibacter algae TaxID=454151 RepID=A0ABW5D9U9_9BACT